MKRFGILIVLCCFLAGCLQAAALAENEKTVSSIRDMVMAEKPPFSFRNGVTWGMNPQQVSAIEDIPMEQRSSQEWSVMLSADTVPVSRFSADLVYMFYQDALRMITYEFQKDCSSLNYQYLTGALCSVYGDVKTANPSEIKGWMDRIYQNYYQQDMIHQAVQWTADDGTTIFLYYFTDTTYAILYVCPLSNGGSVGYDTNGL